VPVDNLGKHVVEIALDRGGYGMLFDQDFNIISHANPDFVGLNLYDSRVPISVFADEITSIDGEQVLAGSVESLTGEDYVAFIRELPNGWHIALLTPKGPFYHGLTGMMLNLCLLGATLAAVLIGILVRIDRGRNKADAESKQKSVFLANMSHEIRTPMNAIIGMTALGRSAKGSERKDYCLSRIDDASHYLLGVINDILDMSKIEANKLELSPTEFDFRKMLRSVVDVSSFRVDEKKQVLTVTIDKGIPATLVGDEQRLAQVVSNLLSNSVKFTPELGSINLVAHLVEKKGENCLVQISVSDTGIGISSEQQDSLFRAFSQAESSTTRKYGGTGLGLSICKSIVGMMRGEIEVESELGRGSTFVVTVPLKGSNAGATGKAAHKKARHEDEPADVTGAFGGRRILLAEDVELNREIVVSLLEPTRLEIVCAENGLEATRKFAESPEDYDMILMDLQMPEMDGYEATRRIRAMNAPNARTIPIIALTANVFREDVDRCIEAGMNGHLGKPLDYETIMNKLRDHLLFGAHASRYAEAS